MANVTRTSGPLDGLRILVTAGPTHESIDPVRYISNRSSGKMGYALAQVAHERGAKVTLVSGPVESLVRDTVSSAIRVIPVVTAAEMFEAVGNEAHTADVIVMAAAVADFKPAEVQSSKLKKSDGVPEVQLVPTTDILGQLAELAPDSILIGFAAETDDLIAHGQSKLRSKGLDMVVANDVSGRNGEVFGADENQVILLRSGQEPQALPRLPKEKVAGYIMDQIPELLRSATNLPE
jgi:phosphopantothenoylcysteine decarboxylase/phosphopantothenate--cysteine ligase